MAKGMDVVEKSLEDLEREITCAICQEHYTEPKVLPCLHYYCKQCILSLTMPSYQRFSCPECRKEAILPEGDVDKLPTAFVVNRLMDTHATLGRACSIVDVTCELCTASEAKANSFCRQCAEFICNKCAESHHRMKTFTGHEVVSLKDLKEGTAKDIVRSEPPSQKCPTHEEPLIIYCFRCKCLICRDCTLDEHKYHTFKYSNVEAPKKRKTFQEKLTSLREVKLDLSNLVEEIQTSKCELEARGDSMTNTIKTSFEELQQILETCKRQLLMDAGRKVREKLNNLVRQEESVSIASAAVQSVVDYTEQCLSFCADNEVMCMHAEIEKRLNKEIGEHGKRWRNVDPVEEVDVSVEVNCAEAMRQLCRTNAKITQHSTGPKFTVSGEGAKTAEVDKTSEFVLTSKGKCATCSTIDSNVRSLIDETIMQCTIDQIGSSKFRIQYTPTVRGRHELTLSVDGQQISGSPFPVFVSIPPTELGTRIKVWYGYRNPCGITVNSVGEIIVAEQGGDIIVLDRDGKKLRRIKGSDYEFSHVQGVATDHEDNIYFSEITCNRIFKSNKDCSIVQFEETDQGEIAGHHNIAVVGNEVMVSERYCRGSIMVYDLQLKFVRQILSVDRAKVSGIFSDSSGNLYISQQYPSCIRVLSNEGEIMRTFGDDDDDDVLRRPWGLCVAGQYVFVADEDKIVVFTTEGDYVTSFGRGSHVCVDQDGFVYVCCYRSDRIEMY